MKDAKFSADDISFQKLCDDAFVCVMNKQHPLAQKCKKRRQKSVSSADFWPYRQIIDIPPYLLKHVFSRGHHIVPVNDELDNIICATTSEAYNILLGSKPGSVHIKMAQMEQKIDDMTEDYREHQLERLKSGSCSGDACVIYSEMLTDFERLGDHMLNIAEAAAESNLISLKMPEDVNVEEEPKSKKKIAAAKA